MTTCICSERGAATGITSGDRGQTYYVYHVVVKDRLRRGGAHGKCLNPLRVSDDTGAY